MSQERIVIWGTGGHARVVADVVVCQATYTIAGFLDDLNPIDRRLSFNSAPVLGGREQLRNLAASNVKHVIIGIGNCQSRLEIAEITRYHGLNLATVIHPQAIIAKDVYVGNGSLIVAGAIINSGAEIGSNVIVNTAASVDHDCRIEDGAHICPGVRLAGNVVVGQAAWIGIGAVVIEGVRIGARSVIGAGSVVLRDIPDNTVAYGVPARVARLTDRKKG